MERQMAINLGDKVKDTVTGFTGIAIARTTWLHGCDRITVQPPLGKDGKHPDNFTFDEKQLVLVKSGVVKTESNKPSTARTGGPQDDKAALRR
jgi:hypothetical protein